MKHIKKLLILGVLLINPFAMAHEGHGLPGSIPPPSHPGGIVKEAKTVGGNGKVELFFEVVHKKKQLKIYPATITSENPSVFTPVAPGKLSKILVKTAVPTRGKKKSTSTKTLKVKQQKDSAGVEFLGAVFDAKRANRFIVEVSATYKNEKKLAKIQVEKH